MGKVVQYSVSVVLLFLLCSVGGDCTLLLRLAESRGFGDCSVGDADFCPVEFPSDVELPTAACPHGFDFLGNSCGRVTHAAAILECPRRWVLDRHTGMCVCTERTEGILTCPHYDDHPEFTLDGGWCVRMDMVEPQLTCPQGLVLSGGICSRSSAYPSTAICAERGFQVKGDLCFRESKSAPGTFCPPGFFPSDRDGCVAYEEMAPEQICRAGFELSPDDHGFCFRNLTSPPNLVCEEGFRMRTNGVVEECVKLHVTQANPVCEERGELRGHECVEDLSEMPELVCRNGFQLQNNMCVKIIEEAVKLMCRHGFHLNQEGTMCISQDVFPPELLCDMGFELRHGRCERIETMPPCVICDGPLEQLIDGVCVSVLRDEAKNVCLPGFFMTDTGCKKAIHAPEELICSTGLELRGRFCVNYETLPAEYVCRRGGELSPGGEECVQVVSKDAGLVCPHHYRLDVQHRQCIKEVMVAPEVLCDVGETILTSRFGMCERENMQPPTMRCPRGFSTEPIAMPWGSGSPRCSRVEEAECIYRCERGYRLIHRMCIPIHPIHPVPMRSQKSVTKKWRKDTWRLKTTCDAGSPC